MSSVFVENLEIYFYRKFLTSCYFCSIIVIYIYIYYSIYKDTLKSILYTIVLILFFLSSFFLLHFFFLLSFLTIPVGLASASDPASREVNIPPRNDLKGPRRPCNL